MDYTLKVMSRKENFIDWFAWSLELKDCDPAIHLTNYLFDRFEHNLEQKIWIAWIYGTTYHLPTTWVIWNEFPDMELVGTKRLEDWNNENYKRLRYQTDTKWNKGHLPSQFTSYKNWVGDRSQREAFSGFLKGSRTENFDMVWNEVKSKFHKFGRYSTWFYLQTLRDCCKFPIDASSLMLEDYSGSRSHRNGLCYALDKQDWIDEKLDKLDFLNKGATDIITEAKERHPHLDFEYFGMETCLCSFKKLFRKTNGRYLSYYLDRQAEEITKVQSDGWHGIDWKPLWDFRTETLNKKTLTNRIDKSKMSIFLSSGIIDYMEIFSEELRST